jgi:hypothetical protein
MSEISRRGFVGAMVALPAGAVVLGDLFIAPDDRALLHALAGSVLPAELGPAGIRRMTDGFERWLSNYRPGAEVNHGYGTGRLEQLPPDPWPRWRVQLQELDARSRQQYGRTFDTAAAAQREQLVTTVLDELKAERLTDSLTAPHVALGLLSWFVSTPEATDLCYHARIGKETCRPLAATVKEPARI